MRDTIYRQDAIDALGDEPEVWTGKDEYAMGLNNQWHYDRNAILRCPSAQPETEERTAESAQNVPNDELISRKAAIDELLQIVQDRYAWQKDALEYVRGVNAAICAIEKLPSAQPNIIRCKDCVYWDSLPSRLTPEYHECVERPFHINTTAEDFCSRGREET